ncbi:uncharacterized protein METZ01_LOCUS155421, partial [marine metagenome]
MISSAFLFGFSLDGIISQYRITTNHTGDLQ